MTKEVGDAGAGILRGAELGVFPGDEAVLGDAAPGLVGRRVVLGSDGARRRAQQAELVVGGLAVALFVRVDPGCAALVGRRRDGRGG